MNPTYTDILAMDAYDLIDYLTDTHLCSLPVSINTIEDMENASTMLLTLSASYSYLCSLLAFSKVMTRDAKRNLDKQEYEDFVDKRDIIDQITSAVKQQYNALSRAVTIHIENNNELKMGGKNI